MIKKKFRITGERSYVQVEKLDLDDGSVVRKWARVWTNVTVPNVSFSWANKNQQRLLEATRQVNGDIIIKLFDKDCTDLNKDKTWEKVS